MESTRRVKTTHLILESLYSELVELKDFILERAHERLDGFAMYYPDSQPTQSAINLSHYLALRERDLRPLQEKLARTGLSSLGRAEPHVYASLNSVIAVLGLALQHHKSAMGNFNDYGFSEGLQLHEGNTKVIFGKAPLPRSTRIMVTLSSDAAMDFNQIKMLLDEGMDCVRINCAHDNPTIWHSMIDNVRRASALINKDCRILMDLAGHKIRTGPVANQSPVLHLRVKRDVVGTVISPSIIHLVAEQHLHPANGIVDSDFYITIPNDIFANFSSGDRLVYRDARSRPRFIVLDQYDGTGKWSGTYTQNAYVPLGTVFTWQAKRDNTYHSIAEFPLTSTPARLVDIHLHKNDLLLLSKQEILGQPAQPDAGGKMLVPACIACSEPRVIDKLVPGNRVWIDDGKIGCTVISIQNDGALLRVVHVSPKGVRLKAEKGLNFPDTVLDLPALSTRDFQDLDFICKHADMIGFSFVESLEDMNCLLDALAKRQATSLPIIAKIETARAIRELHAIILGTMGRHPLGLMIARGDLAVELGSVRMAEIQEEILWLAEAAHIPVIWATQVLESIAKKGTRSRPELTDAAMSVRAECVMLNKGPYIVDAVRLLNAILSRMQAHQQKKKSRLRALRWGCIQNETTETL